MSQDALHHGRVVDHRDQPEAPSTPGTGRYIETHAAAHQFRPEVVADRIARAGPRRAKLGSAQGTRRPAAQILLASGAPPLAVLETPSDRASRGLGSSILAALRGLRARSYSSQFPTRTWFVMRCMLASSCRARARPAVVTARNLDRAAGGPGYRALPSTGDRDSALREEILHVPKTDTEPVVQPHRVTDDRAETGILGSLAYSTVPGPPSS